MIINRDNGVLWEFEDLKMMQYEINKVLR